MRDQVSAEPEVRESLEDLSVQRSRFRGGEGCLEGFLRCLEWCDDRPDPAQGLQETLGLCHVSDQGLVRSHHGCSKPSSECGTSKSLEIIKANVDPGGSRVA